VKLALDTNVLAYAEGVDDEDRRTRAMALIERIPADLGVIPAQVLGELFNVLVRKAGRSRDAARLALLSWQDAFLVAPTEPSTVSLAADLAADHRIGIWDAVILAAASQAGCRFLLSEDLENEFTWGGVTVVNPFSDAVSPMLDSMLGINS
jgi:predicted nucleic acid-binding protein